MAKKTKAAPKKTAKNTKSKAVKKAAPKKTAKKAEPKNTKVVKKSVRRKYTGSVAFVSGGDVLKASRCVALVVPGLFKQKDSGEIQKYIGSRLVKHYGTDCTATYVTCEDPQQVYDDFTEQNEEALVSGTNSTYKYGQKEMSSLLKSVATVTKASRIKFADYVDAESDAESDDEVESGDEAESDAEDVEDDEAESDVEDDEAESDDEDAEPSDADEESS